MQNGQSVSLIYAVLKLDEQRQSFYESDDRSGPFSQADCGQLTVLFKTVGGILEYIVIIEHVFLLNRFWFQKVC